MADARRIDGIDSDLALSDLLSSQQQQIMLHQLSEALGEAVSLHDSAPAGGSNAALIGDCEPLAYLHTEREAPALAVVAALINERIASERKYRMVSGVHEAVVANDYAALRRKHQALKASEARFRVLHDGLEQRISEEVQTVNRAERKLYEADKLASVGQLAAGVAHEINNPVGFVTSNLNMAYKYVERLQRYVTEVEKCVERAKLPRSHGELCYLFEDFAELLKESVDGCERVTAIVRNLKDFSNIDGQARSSTSINKLVENACQLYASQLPPGVTLKQNLHPVPSIEANPGMLSQLLAQLLVNAIAAVRERPADRAGRIAIGTESKDGVVRFTVADNGCGMSAEVCQHAFEPFYTTRAVGSGTGLGLTVSHDIVEAHQGDIRLSSQPGRGTVVTVSLPLEDSA